MGLQIVAHHHMHRGNDKRIHQLPNVQLVHAHHAVNRPNVLADSTKKNQRGRGGGSGPAVTRAAHMDLYCPPKTDFERSRAVLCRRIQEQDLTSGQADSRMMATERMLLTGSA